LLSLEEIKHRDLSQKKLIEFCKIKSKSWSYSLESQEIWISENIKPDDFHLILRDEGQIVSYLSIIDTSFFIDDIQYHGFGVGSVCTAYKGKGYGGKIIESANNFIYKKRGYGLLFCKDFLIDFYKKYDWCLIDRNRVKFRVDLLEINTMTFNAHEVFKSFDYKLKLF
jgi:predicted GNAT family N-acyltransferase